MGEQLKDHCGDVTAPLRPGGEQGLSAPREELYREPFGDAPVAIWVEDWSRAKAMIDQGVHPMTMYFPLVVHGALLMEPTETESRALLDQYIGMVKSLARRAIEGEVDFFKEAPRLAPRRRLDETAAARNPVLRWRPGDQVAAE